LGPAPETARQLKRFTSAATGYLELSALAVSIAAKSSVRRTGFGRHATAPADRQRWRTVASVLEVMMIVGIFTPLSLNVCCNSKPLVPGICKSRIRQSGKPSAREPRNCCADSNVLVIQGRVLSSLSRAFKNERSSSTTAIKRDAFLVMAAILD
jgi:hypothetical protein